MGDLGDYWREHRDYTRKRKAKTESYLMRSGYKDIEEQLDKLGLRWESEQGRYRIYNKEGVWVDYWPTTGRIYGGPNNIDSIESKMSSVGIEILKLLSNKK